VYRCLLVLMLPLDLYVAWRELLPFLILGSAASHAVHRRVTGRFLRAFVLLFASASGVVLVLR
jgi:hypothetical protein